MLMLLAILSLSACGGKDSEPGQALVRVAGEEITVHQLNDELSRLENPSAATQQQVLEVLIERQLLKNAAVHAKLERDPDVMQAIERSKAQILAEAYLRNKIASAVPPSKAELSKYYNQHPDLFARRKLIETKELIFETKEAGDNVQSITNTAGSVDALAASLDAHHIRYVRRHGSRSTLDMPAEMAAKVSAMEPGQSFIVKDGSRSTVVFITSIKETPVGLAEVEKQIEQYLTNQKRRELGRSEVKRLRSATTIEYMNKGPDNPTNVENAEMAVNHPAPEEHVKQGVAGLK